MCGGNGERPGGVAGQPPDDGIDFVLRAALAFRLLDQHGIDPRERHAVWLLVQAAADAVPAEIADDAEAVGSGGTFHRLTDAVDQGTGADLGEGVAQGQAGGLAEPGLECRGWWYHGGTTVVPPVSAK